MLKKINAEVLAHIFTILQKAIGTHVHKGSNKAACLWKMTTANQTAFNARCKNTSFFRSWYLYKIAAYFFTSVPSKSLHSNAKIPSLEILSQYIATFFLVA